jgi:hypothetical protein
VEEFLNFSYLGWQSVLQIGIRFALRVRVKEDVAIKEHKYAPRHAAKEMNVYILSFAGFFRADRFHAAHQNHCSAIWPLPFLWVTAAALHDRLKISHIGDRV